MLNEYGSPQYSKYNIYDSTVERDSVLKNLAHTHVRIAHKSIGWSAYSDYIFKSQHTHFFFQFLIKFLNNNVNVKKICDFNQFSILNKMNERY